MKKSSITEIVNAQRQPFKCAVFSGGGAKGAIYSGAHEALSRAGIIKNLEAVAGSSAGAITAAMIATGISSKRYQEISEKTNFKELLGEGFVINKDGKPLLELLRSSVRGNILDYLEKADVPSVCARRLEAIEILKSVPPEQLSPTEKQEYQQELTRQEHILLKLIASGGTEIEKIKQKSGNPEGRILFRDLALLRVLDPETFKDLAVTATRRDTGELEFFDARNAPDVEVALACRASASIPLVFEPVKIDGLEYVDGGYRDNIPLARPGQDRPAAPQANGAAEEIPSVTRTDRTLALVFGSSSKDEANIAIFSAIKCICTPGGLAKFLMDVVFKVLAGVGGKFKYFEEENKTYTRLRENALNTFVLDTGKVSTLSFELAQERGEYLHLKGFMQTARYLDNHNIAPIKDPSFEFRDFLLNVYGASQIDTRLQKFQNKFVSGSKSEKSQILLELCKDEPWKNKSKEELLLSFIETAATSRTSGRLSIETSTMKALLEGLNNAYTPEAVKKEFIQLLGVDIQKDKNFDPKKNLSENLTSFKFDKKDLEGFLEKRQISKPQGKFASKIKKQVDRSLPTKTQPVAQQSKTNTERLLESRANNQNISRRAK